MRDVILTNVTALAPQDMTSSQLIRAVYELQQIVLSLLSQDPVGKIEALAEKVDNSTRVWGPVASSPEQRAVETAAQPSAEVVTAQASLARQVAAGDCDSRN